MIAVAMSVFGYKSDKRPRKLRWMNDLVCWRQLTRSYRRHGSTVDHIICAMNRRCAIRCEKTHQFSNLFRPTRATEGNASDHVHDLLPSGILVAAAALCKLNDHAVCA